jgi:hypothetical protein
MRRSLFVAVLGLVFVATACSTVSTQQIHWREAVTPTTALPQKVALFVDATFLLRTEDGRRYVAITESIDMGHVIDDAAETALTGAKMKMAVKGKFFISAYRDVGQLTAQEEDGGLFTRQAPVHLAPSVCRTKKTTAAMTRIWRAARAAFAGKSPLPVEVLRDFGARYQADTIALVMAVSRKEDKSSDTLPLVTEPMLGSLGASLVAVVVIRAIDGRIVYQGAAPIHGPQRESTWRSAVATALAGIPTREGHPAYPVPKIATGSTSTDADADASPWVQPPQRQRQGSAFPAPKLDPAEARPGLLTGQDEIALLRRPMALADPIAVVGDNTEVMVLKRDMNWYLVQLRNGQMGWVYQTWVTVY